MIGMSKKSSGTINLDLDVKPPEINRMAVNAGSDKKALLIRHGAYGDGIMITCVFRRFIEDGYQITVYGNPKTAEVLKDHPLVYSCRHHDTNVPIGQELEKRWKKISAGYDKVVNFTGVVENSLLFSYPQPEYFKPWPIRHHLARMNYWDAHLIRAGYTPKPPTRGELFFSFAEKRKAQSWEKKHRGMFKIVWALAGSSHHKVYRYYEPVAKAFLMAHNDAVIFAVGDYPTKLLTFEHPRCFNTMMMQPEFTFRDTMLLTKHADLVIGPETGTIVAAGCFDTPIIALLTHSSENNLTKYFKNCHSIQAPTWCSPCHLLFKYTFIWQYKCQLGTAHTCACCEHGPGDVYEKMEEEYVKWKVRQTGTARISGISGRRRR